MKKYFSAIVFVLSLTIFFFLGFSLGQQNIQKQDEKIQAVGSPDISLVWDAWNIIKNKYIGETDKQKQVYGLVAGLVASLNDPYSIFMEPGQNKRFLSDLSGELEGIGAELEIRNRNLVVVAPMENSPAAKAGLKPKDIIYKINNEETAKMTFEQAIDKIRGKPGTDVNLTIVREDEQKPLELKITRAKITIKSVRYEMRPDGIAYLKISQFGENTTQLAKESADELVKNNPKAIILDLRNNPGGYLDAAVDIASLFLEQGVVTYEEGKDGKKKAIRTTLAPALKKFKTIVLVNNGSASGSEIVAGALQDNKRAAIIGERTFGKGSVQNIEELKDGSAVRLTTAKWLTPKGKTINSEGIKPDIEIKISEDDERNGRDTQMEQAISELLK